MINNSTDIRYTPKFGAVANPHVNTVNYAATPMNANDVVDNNAVVSRAKKAETGWLVVPATMAAWFGLCKGMDYVNNNLVGKDYAETPFGKIGAWGDKISEGYANSSFAKSNAGQKVNGFFSKVKTFMRDKVVGKSKLLTAIKDTPAKPESKMVVNQAYGLLGLHTMDVDQVLKPFTEKVTVAQQLEQYGMKQDAINKLVQELKGKTKEQKAARLLQEEYKLFGVNSEKALREAKIKALGFADAAQFERVMGEPLKCADEIKQALSKANSKMYIMREVGEGKLGGIRKHLFKRKVTFKELENKYTVVLGQGAKTKLGRNLSKALGWVMEGFTNRFAGGKMVALMQATFLAQAFVAATKADGVKDKTKTFIEQNVNLFSYIFAAPLAVAAIFRFGGMKYAGMTKQQVEDYRKALEIHNAKAKAGLFKSKQEWKTSKKALDNMLKAGVKNPFVKFGKFLGRTINFGNEFARPYISHEKTNLNFMRKTGRWLKNASSYPLRGVLGMFVLVPFIANTVTKISNAIFGKPVHSVLDEEEEQVDEQAVNQQLSLLRQEALNRQQAAEQHNQYMADNANVPKMDLLQQYKNGQMNQTTTTTTQNKKDEYKEPVRTYIPSPVGVQLAAPDYSVAQKAIQQSQAAEQEALRVLGLN